MSPRGRDVRILWLFVWVLLIWLRSSSLSLLPSDEKPEMSKSATTPVNVMDSGPRRRSGFLMNRDTTMRGTWRTSTLSSFDAASILWQRQPKSAVLIALWG